MPDRTIAPRLRRIGVCIALLAAFAGASAQGAGAATYHPLNATDLFNDVTAANSTPGFNVIDLCDCKYLPTGGGTSGPNQSMVITGNLEITGPPQLQPSQFNPPGQEPQINGQNQVVSLQSLFTISAGANVIFKAFDLESSGGNGFPAVAVQGNLEIDNMALAGNIGDAVDISAAPAPASAPLVTVNNSTISSNDNSLASGAAINNTATSAALTLNNATITGNSHTGVQGTFTSHNTLFGPNNPSCVGGGATGGDVTSEDTDGTCAVTFSLGAPNLGPVQFNGGPTVSAVPGTGSDAIGAGTASWCERSDQRFFTAAAIPPTSCDIGAIQTGDTLQSDTAGPTCHVVSTNNTQGSPNQTQQVSATDVGIAGQGADTINNWTIVFKPSKTAADIPVGTASPTTISVTATSGALNSGQVVSVGGQTFTLNAAAAAGSTSLSGSFATTPTTVDIPAGSTVALPGNGTVTFPTVTGTLFDNSTGGATAPPILDSPSSLAFPVTANKTPTDTTAHDTFWSFDATDWFGNITLCQ